MSEDIRIAGTEDLAYLIADAQKRQYNRQVSTQIIPELDPQGKHVLMRVLAWHNEGDHHRTSVLMKMTGDANPQQAFLDVHEDAWDKLSTVEQVKKELGLTV